MARRVGLRAGARRPSPAAHPSPAPPPPRRSGPPSAHPALSSTSFSASPACAPGLLLSPVCPGAPLSPPPGLPLYLRSFILPLPSSSALPNPSPRSTFVPSPPEGSGWGQCWEKGVGGWGSGQAGLPWSMVLGMGRSEETGEEVSTHLWGRRGWEHAGRKTLTAHLRRREEPRGTVGIQLWGSGEVRRGRRRERRREGPTHAEPGIPRGPGRPTAGRLARL